MPFIDIVRCAVVSCSSAVSNMARNRSGSTDSPAVGVGLAEDDASGDSDAVPEATDGLEGLLESVLSSPPQAVIVASARGTSAAAAVRRTRSRRGMGGPPPDRPRTLPAD